MKKKRKNIYDDLGIPRPQYIPADLSNFKLSDFLLTLFAGFLGGVVVSVIVFVLCGGI